VQTPTLSVVVEREEQIRKFVSRDFWEIHAEFAAAAGTYPAKWFNPQHKKDAEDKEKKEDRVWSLQEAQAVADAVRGKSATVTEESKPRSESSKGLFDLTTLQKEANSRFGFSAKTTLSLAQSLYERHKALTYPRTDSQHLPEDYLQTVKDTMEMLAKSPMKHLAPFAKTAIDQGYIKPSPKVFNNAKVSDHFAIIPTLQAPSGL
jgi:DNA topoisomerase-3